MGCFIRTLREAKPTVLHVRTTYKNAHTHTQHIFTKTNTNIPIHTPHLNGEMERYGMQNGQAYTHTNTLSQSKTYDIVHYI